MNNKKLGARLFVILVGIFIFLLTFFFPKEIRTQLTINERLILSLFASIGMMLIEINILWKDLDV